MLPDSLFDICQPLTLKCSKEPMMRVSVEEEAAFLQENASRRAKVLDIRNTSDMMKVCVQ